MFDFDGANIGLVFLLFTQSREGAKFFILSMIIVEFSVLQFSVFRGIRFLTTKNWQLNKNQQLSIFVALRETR
jgi:hypothetical protein